MPLNAEPGSLAEISVKDFRIVAGCLDGPHRPVSIQPPVGAAFAFNSEQSPDSRVLCSSYQVINRRCRYFQRLGIDQDREDPADNVEPLFVAVANRGLQRFF
jgi:hypothetical protein